MAIIITAEYKCDSCKKSESTTGKTKEQWWSVDVGLAWIERAIPQGRTEKQRLTLCRPCVEKFGWIPVVEEKLNHVIPQESVADKLAELISQIAVNAVGDSQ